MVAPVVLQVCMFLAGSALVVQHFVKPRLPVYRLQMLLWKLPTFTKSVNDEWRTVVHSNIEMFNENYLHIDVHNLSFDMLAWNLHLGNLQQYQKPQSTTDDDSGGMAEEEEQTSHDDNNNNNIWSIEARSNFTTTSQLYLKLQFGNVVKSLYRIMKSWYYGNGQLVLPTTGVAHIRASSTSMTASTTTSTTSSKKKNRNKKKKKNGIKDKLTSGLPFTVSIICDNVVDTWSMTVTGTECAMYNMVPGWGNMDVLATNVRQYALSLPVNTDTGGILSHPGMSWEEVLNTIAWEESMQLLS